MECTLKIILCLAILIWCMRKAAVSLQAEPLPHWSSKQRLLRSLYTVVSRVKPRPWKVSFAASLCVASLRRWCNSSSKEKIFQTELSTCSWGNSYKRTAKPTWVDPRCQEPSFSSSWWAWKCTPTAGVLKCTRLKVRLSYHKLHPIRNVSNEVKKWCVCLDKRINTGFILCTLTQGLNLPLKSTQLFFTNCMKGRESFEDRSIMQKYTIIYVHIHFHVCFDTYVYFIYIWILTDNYLIINIRNTSQYDTSETWDPKVRYKESCITFISDDTDVWQPVIMACKGNLQRTTKVRISPWFTTLGFSSASELNQTEVFEQLQESCSTSEQHLAWG